MENNLYTVIETPVFMASAKKLSEDLIKAIINYLAENPDAGDIIQGTGGIRKIRFSKEGTGKSGGVRVIYFYHPQVPIFLLDVYSKNVKENISAEDRNELKKLSAILVKTYQNRR